MGKHKNKDDAPNPNSISNRDIIQRLNFLYQASVLLNGITTPDDGPSLQREESTSRTLQPQRSHHRRRRMVTTSELSRSYIDTMKIVGMKTNVKMDPSVKRLICKTCSMVLVPGVSSTVRVKDSTSHGHLVSYSCHSCQTERRIPAPPVLDLTTAAVESGQDVQAESLHPEPLSEPTSSAPNKRRRKRRPSPVRRLPPHFARNVGHVVSRGNERVSDVTAS